MDRPVPVLVKDPAFSDSGNRFSCFNHFSAALSSLSPVERYEAEFMGASEFLTRPAAVGSGESG